MSFANQLFGLPGIGTFGIRELDLPTFANYDVGIAQAGVDQDTSIFSVHYDTFSQGNNPNAIAFMDGVTQGLGVAALPNTPPADVPTELFGPASGFAWPIALVQ